MEAPKALFCSFPMGTRKNFFEIYMKKLGKRPQKDSPALIQVLIALTVLVMAISTWIGVLDLYLFVPVDSLRMALRCRKM